MLPKNIRLTKNKEFENVFKNGRSSFDETLGIKSARNKLDYSRFGILVGNKVSKKAVLRNMVKRRIRAGLHENMPKIKAGFDIVIIALPPSAKKNFAELSRSLGNNLARLRLLKK